MRDKITLINTVVIIVKVNLDRGIINHDLHAEKLRIVVFTHSSFANNVDSSAQLGYLIFLADDTDRPNVLNYPSYKAKLIVR